MINNQGTESKHSTAIKLDGTTGVKGDLEYPVFAETQVRVDVLGVGSTNVLTVEGRIRNSGHWIAINTVTGATTAVADVSTYDYIRYNVTTADSAGNAYGSGFFLKAPSSGGGGAVDSVNGQTGTVVLTFPNKATIGGDTKGSAISLGTNDAYPLHLRANGTDFVYINTDGTTTVGGDTSSMTSIPNTFGTYKFQTIDDSRSFNVFDNFFSYYGNSGNSKDGTLFRMSLRPGETYFQYSGDYNALRADGFVSQPGLVTSFTALKTAVASANTGAIITEAKGLSTVVTPAQGIIRNAVGVEVDTVQAAGTDSGTGHVSTGVLVDTVVASGSDTSNISHGIHITNNVTASGTGAKAYAIKSDSTADSKFAGLIELAGLSIDIAPGASPGQVVTHKIPILVNGSLYYMLLSNV